MAGKESDVSATFRQMKRRVRPSHLRVLDGGRYWLKPQTRYACVTPLPI